MAELVPYPFDGLVHRMVRELQDHQAIYDLPERRFFLGDADHDFSVPFHGRRVSSPLGPAAGPQTQMAQNIVLSWLGGSRVMELKTVQINDELDIPRPCIDMQTIGFNAEWSQELKLEQSLDEYVKGAMLVEMLRHELGDKVAPGFESVEYDMSVGYDLKGIQTDRMMAFMRGMLNAKAEVEKFRAQIPEAYKHFRDLEYPTKLSDTLTLSTFHGCPPEEIEGIIDFLLRKLNLNCVIKFNPMLLGPQETRHLLHDVMGYQDIKVPDSAFERDATWEQATGMMERLAETASSLGLSLGAKFSNTLIVENDARFLPASEKEVYLSGQPLHVLAMNLVKRFRGHFGDRFPISFAAGIDRGNFPDAVALGLVPITVCSDLLKPQGYGRLQTYNANLVRRMDKVGANSVDDFVLCAYEGNALKALTNLELGENDPVHQACAGALENGSDLETAAGEEVYAKWVSEARLLNTETYVAAMTADPRYSLAQNSKLPKKIGSELELFNCISCDKCIPVCPNDANFAFTPSAETVPIVKLQKSGENWSWNEEGETSLTEKHQIANFADFCNECGNCDIFCPEDGGPYVVKPRFFGSVASWNELQTHDGFFIERTSEGERILGRFQSREFELISEGDQIVFIDRSDKSEVQFNRTQPNDSFKVLKASGGTIDLT
ncbi:MAG: glutamate synthase, partial [Candidatus Eisenbacteria bacterium]|nr:glutamate synthase [Candidatus Eisenbacteria bacterium]